MQRGTDACTGAPATAAPACPRGSVGTPRGFALTFGRMFFGETTLDNPGKQTDFALAPSDPAHLAASPHLLITSRARAHDHPPIPPTHTRNATRTPPPCALGGKHYAAHPLSVENPSCLAQAAPACIGSAWLVSLPLRMRVGGSGHASARTLATHHLLMLAHVGACVLWRRRRGACSLLWLVARAGGGISHTPGAQIMASPMSVGLAATCGCPCYHLTRRYLGLRHARAIARKRHGRCSWGLAYIRPLVDCMLLQPAATQLCTICVLRLDLCLIPVGLVL